MFESFGRLDFASTENILRAVINEDFARYYQKLFYFESFKTIPVWRARHGVHITVFNPKFHGKILAEKLLKFHDQLVSFLYDPREIYQGGDSKGFVGFYLPVYSEQIKKIQAEIGINDEELGRTLHVSLFNNKKHFQK